MTILLKKDWDINIAPPNKKPSIGHFAGRKEEVSQLTNEVLRRNSGAILISGHRGVGKTSLVYKALRKAQEQDKSITIILMNAAQLEVDEDKPAGSTDKINPKKIIENLIRRLYSVAAVENIGAEKEIETLYKKAVSKEVERKELLEQSNNIEWEAEKEKNYQFKVDEINKKTFITMVSWTLAVAYQIGGVQIFGGSVIDKVLPLILAFPLPYAINYFYSSSENIKETKKHSQGVAEIYKFDNAIGNLEYDLELVHSKLAANKRKLIYLIDELDKLTLNQVKEVLKYFKNLFTLSEAIFVFIGGEDLFTLGGNERLGNRDKEYTYFTSRYYLSRPRWQDLNEYIDGVILSKKNLSDEDFEVFKRSICFDAGNDFFDIRTQIRDRINGFRDDFPEISYEVTETDTIKARLHKAITLLYEDRYMYLNPLMWNKNEDLLRTIYSKAYEIQKSYYGFSVSDPRGPDLNHQVVRDFYKFLNRLEVLNLTAEAAETINNVSVPIRSYSVVNKIPNAPPFKFTDPTEFEMRYMQAFREYVEIALLLSNTISFLNSEYSITFDEFIEYPNKTFDILNDLGINFREIFDTQKKIYLSVVNQVHPYPYQREVLDENTKSIRQFCANLMSVQLRIVLPRLLKSVIREPLEIASFGNNSQLFAGVSSVLRSSLLEKGIKSEVLFKTDFSRQILFLSNGIEVVDQQKDILREISQTHLIVYVSQDKIEKNLPGLVKFSVYDVSSLKESLDNLMLLSLSFFQKK